jgi:hypothetical protein
MLARTPVVYTKMKTRKKRERNEGGGTTTKTKTEQKAVNEGGVAT